jgi:hypothetical protein
LNTKKITRVKWVLQAFDCCRWYEFISLLVERSVAEGVVGVVGGNGGGGGGFLLLFSSVRAMRGTVLLYNADE